MDNAQTSRLDVNFKGNRSYLHGTDLFDAMIAVCRGQSRNTPANIRMSFYRPITHPVEAVLAAVTDSARARPAALFEARIDDQLVVWSLRERMDDQITGRRPYDEDRVAAGSVVEGSSITQLQSTEYSFIERAVALNKRLLDRLLGDGGTSWWFARIELSIQPPPSPGIRLAVETGVGNRLVKSSVEIDGTRVGSIYFSENRSG